jgi:NTP pyrophosphatase (non-canonical NTP hydrolase)
MASALAEEIFAYVSGRLNKDHPDGEGSHFIYLSEIEKIIQKHMQNTTPKPDDKQITHAQMVQKLIKSGGAVLSALTETGAKLMHATFGISGEAGELLDAVKKHIIYGKPLDRENVVEELGDLEFYLEDLRATLGITREETIEANMAKLAKRYPNYDYTDASAIARADKSAEAPVLEDGGE